MYTGLYLKPTHYIQYLSQTCQQIGKRLPKSTDHKPVILSVFEATIGIFWEQTYVVKNCGDTLFFLTLNAMPGMHVLQKAAMMLTQKKGTQQSRKVPMMMPTVMAALWSLTW